MVPFLAGGAPLAHFRFALPRSAKRGYICSKGDRGPRIKADISCQHGCRVSATGMSGRANELAQHSDIANQKEAGLSPVDTAVYAMRSILFLTRT